MISAAVLRDLRKLRTGANTALAAAAVSLAMRLDSAATEDKDFATLTRELRQLMTVIMGSQAAVEPNSVTDEIKARRDKRKQEGA